MEGRLHHEAAKKGDLSSCYNYKGQTLLSIPGKVFSRVLVNRMTDADDFNFADGLAPISHSQWQMQKKKKITTVADNSVHLGLKVYRGKGKVLVKNAVINKTLKTLDEDELNDVTSFTCLGKIVDKQGGNWHQCKSENQQGESNLPPNKNIWASLNLTNNIKIRTFNTTIKPFLLYGAETWRTTIATLKKIQTFINTCL